MDEIEKLKSQEGIKELQRQLEESKSRIQALERQLEESRGNRATKSASQRKRGGWFIALVMALAMVLALWHWTTNVKIDAEKATILMQKFVDETPDFAGEVTALRILGTEVCTQPTGGNSCRIDVGFRLNGQFETGICSYGFGKAEKCFVP